MSDRKIDAIVNAEDRCGAPLPAELVPEGYRGPRQCLTVIGGDSSKHPRHRAGSITWPARVIPRRERGLRVRPGVADGRHDAKLDGVLVGEIIRHEEHYNIARPFTMRYYTLRALNRTTGKLETVRHATLGSKDAVHFSTLRDARAELADLMGVTE